MYRYVLQITSVQADKSLQSEHILEQRYSTLLSPRSLWIISPFAKGKKKRNAFILLDSIKISPEFVPWF